ncbi:MAG TPA: hypothetical protein PLK90_11510, partial [Clostridiales bacterium]|nr:hypothetical protein [Clostridiales bacterium]
MDLRKFYSELNQKAAVNYEKDIKKIKAANTVLASDSKSEGEFLYKISSMILYFYKFEQKIDGKYFANNSLTKIKKEFDAISNEIDPKNYKTSFLNPDYSVKLLGEKTGRIAYVIFYFFRQYRSFAFEHRIYQMERYNRLFLEMYDSYKTKKKLTDKFLTELVAKYEKRYDFEETLVSYKEMFGKEYTNYKEIVLNSDPKDLRYLYRYNINITKNEIKTAEFFKSYSKKKLDILAKQISKAYEQGF